MTFSKVSPDRLKKLELILFLQMISFSVERFFLQILTTLTLNLSYNFPGGL